VYGCYWLLIPCAEKYLAATHHGAQCRSDNAAERWGWAVGWLGRMAAAALKGGDRKGRPRSLTRARARVNHYSVSGALIF